jgi:alpha-beta hydrolase superfamily lysophospholipase
MALEQRDMRKWKGDLFFVLLTGAAVVGWIRLYPGPTDSPLAPPNVPIDLTSTEIPSYASAEGLKLSYRLYQPTGEVQHVLVLLHDTLLHSGWYANLGQDLAQRGIAVYLPDRRGWGLSSGDRRTVSTDKGVVTSDITAMIATAQSRYPLAKIFLGGHGRGAGLVLGYVASDRPLPGVVLISPYISPGQPNIRADGWSRFVTAHPVEAFLARAGLVDWLVWHYNWPAPMAEVDPLLESKCSISWEQQTVPDDVEAAYQAMTVPVLYIQGQDDPLLDPGKADQVLARFATTDWELQTLPDAGYLTVIDGAASVVADWMRER